MVPANTRRKARQSGRGATAGAAVRSLPRQTRRVAGVAKEKTMGPSAVRQLRAEAADYSESPVRRIAKILV
jgi:hypothetical protein